MSVVLDLNIADINVAEINVPELHTAELNTAELNTAELTKFVKAIDEAQARVAPTWPLDQSIAVNPWWQWRDTPIHEVAALLKAMGDINLLMPPSYYRDLWGTRIQAHHLEQAKAELGVSASMEMLLAYVHAPTMAMHSQWRHMGELLDIEPSHHNKMPWHDEIVHQISQFCALYVQYPELVSQDGRDEEALYHLWKEVVREDKGIAILMDAPRFHDLAQTLPDTLDQLFSQFVTTFKLQGISQAVLTEYLYSLLLDIHGWASWMAYEGWQATLNGTSSKLLKQLIGIRVAWELLLARYAEKTSPALQTKLLQAVAAQFELSQLTKQQWVAQQAYGWVWQLAFELSYQEALQNDLVAANQHGVGTHMNLMTKTPSMQAVFCIDVRSEPMRRALESQADGIETYGFAGFFGLPIAYTQEGSHASRPQLPGLLKPSLHVRYRPNTLKKASGAIHWRKAFDTAPSAFGLVESLGLFKLASLLKPAKEHNTNAFEGGQWEMHAEDEIVSVEHQAQLVANILKAIGFREPRAPYVLLVGHGSHSLNNPHAAGLDCGACGGQSGEVNVRVLAQVLNNAEVRKALHALNVNIPPTTSFVAALHNTTTDQIQVLDGALPSSMATWLEDAQRLAQSNRAKTLGLSASSPEALGRLYEQRSKDWAQLRPEWGLTNNAAFIVGPRNLTKHADLKGRVFLHDYDSQRDPEAALLEQIMTAPMIVTNWINLQYYASVTDHRTYGSGNKMLHNVVADHVGVFEGNGGDLRIGLPLQSIHDGTRWRHEPLRLSVYIAAPKEAIARIIQQHAMIQSLVDHQWLHIIQFDVEKGVFSRYVAGSWQTSP